MLKHTMKQLGGVEEIRSSDGIRYEIRYLANDEEVKKYMPSVGDPAEWTDRDNAYVTRITKTCYAPGMWTILIQAEVVELEDDLASLGINIAGLDSVTEQTYDIGTINFLPEWFGCRQASQGDCTQFSETGVGPIPSGRLKYKRLDGEWANPGDYIARNAVPLYFSPDNDRLVQNAAAGSMTFDRSPFLEQIPEKWIGQTIQTRIYRCVFYTRRNINRISGFRGINGQFGGRCAPDRIEPGAWKARTQSIRYVADCNGNVYARVERTMLEAPGETLWDHEKNGGVWIW